MALQASAEQIQVQGFRIEEVRTKLTTTHNGKDLTFLHPAYGPGTYADVGLLIEQGGLRRPTMAETASLVYAAFNSGDRYRKEILTIMRDRWLWAFTRSRYEKDKGAFIYPEAEHERFKDLSASQLEQLLSQRQEHGVVYSDDDRLRFVPFGYQIGEMSSLQLAQNSYVIALAGKEGAEKLAEFAGKYRDDPHLWGFESVKEPLIRFSALYSDWIDRRLYVCGSNRGDGWNGRSFGVSGKAGEASAPIK